MQTLIKRRGPKRLPEGEKKMTLPVYIPKKMIEAIGYYESGAIAEKAIEKEFNKINK